MYILLVQAGLTPLQALPTVAINGAGFLGVADRKAAIAPGNPLENIANIKSIDAVISRGKAYPMVSLQNLLRAVRHKYDNA